MQGRNGEADVENRLVNTTGEGDGGTNGESSTETYPLPNVEETANGKLPQSAGAQPSALCNQRGGRGWEAPEGGDICTLAADSHCCTAEINTTR